MSRERPRERSSSLALFAALAVVLAFVVSVIASRDGAPTDAPDAADPARPGAERIRVEVLNGGGVPGRARAATKVLRERGFDVVYYGNTPSFGRDSSVVLARTDAAERAEAVARALRIGGVAVEPDSGLYLDVTVILGRDWPPSEPGDSADMAERLLRLLERLGRDEGG